jgi:hypothetical protein
MLELKALGQLKAARPSRMKRRRASYIDARAEFSWHVSSKQLALVARSDAEV